MSKSIEELEKEIDQLIIEVEKLLKQQNELEEYYKKMGLLE